MAELGWTYFFFPFVPVFLYLLHVFFCFLCHYKPIKRFEVLNINLCTDSVPPFSKFGAVIIVVISAIPFTTPTRFSAPVFSFRVHLMPANQRRRIITADLSVAVGAARKHQSLGSMLDSTAQTVWTGPGPEAERRAGRHGAPSFPRLETKTLRWKNVSKQRDQCVFSSLLQTLQGWNLYINVLLLFFDYYYSFFLCVRIP